MNTMLAGIRRMVERGEPIMPVVELLGIDIRAVEGGESEVEMEVAKSHANTMGTLHGGIYCALADTAMGLAFASVLGEGETLATLELKINYLKPVWSGRVRATGRVVKRGRLTGLVECDVRDEGGGLVARASSTFMAIKDERVTDRTVKAG